MSRSIMAALLVLSILAACDAADPQQHPAPQQQSPLFPVLDGAADQAFLQVLAPRPFRFPDDHGAHPRYRNEWWYFTGNLGGQQGQRYGYQLVIFRIALSPHKPQRPSAWATNQLYMAHFAISDRQQQRFHFFERFARGAAGLAGAQSRPLRIWLEDWRIAGDENGWTLQASEGEFAIDLRLTPAKPIVLQGEQGLSRKSDLPGHASYYYSQPRLTTSGTLTIAGHKRQVSGLSWLDREWSSTALAPQQVGWDWFALQLDDDHEFMFYRLRRKNDSADPASSGTLSGPRGTPLHLKLEDVSLTPLEYWRSPHGIRYPLRWRLTVPHRDLELDIFPLLENQELDASVRYWEGAVTVRGSHGGNPVQGRGYMELTGYGVED
ncbi:MAG: lipocalin-like domain-containing protein [Gammaproteobacteria bacterium]